MWKTRRTRLHLQLFSLLFSASYSIRSTFPHSHQFLPPSWLRLSSWGAAKFFRQLNYRGKLWEPAAGALEPWAGAVVVNCLSPLAGACWICRRKIRKRREREREWLSKLLFAGREGKGGKSSLVQAAAADVWRSLPQWMSPLSLALLLNNGFLLLLFFDLFSCVESTWAAAATAASKMVAVLLSFSFLLLKEKNERPSFLLQILYDYIVHGYTVLYRRCCCSSGSRKGQRQKFDA